MLRREQGCRAAKRFLPGRAARGGDQPLQARDAWAHDLVGLQLAGRLAEQQGGLVVLQGALQQPGLQGLHVEHVGVAEAEIPLHRPEVVGARLGAGAVVGQHLRGHAQLAGEVGHCVGRRVLQVVRAEAQIAQQAQLQRDAQLIGRPAEGAQKIPVGDGEGEKGGHVLGQDVERTAAEAVALVIGEDVYRHQ